MPPSMYVPRLIMALAFQVYYVAMLFRKCRAELLLRERNSKLGRGTLNGLNFSKWADTPRSSGRATALTMLVVVELVPAARQHDKELLRQLKGA